MRIQNAAAPVGVDMDTRNSCIQLNGTIGVPVYMCEHMLAESNHTYTMNEKWMSEHKKDTK